MLKIIASLLALLAAGGGVYYFTSDVGKARIDSAHEQYAEWTPENIAEEPLLYLDFCEREATLSLGKLKANDVAVLQNISRISAQKNDVDSKVRVGDAALAELRGLYNEENMKWPVTWRGRRLGEAEYRQQAVQLYKDIELKRRLTGQYALALGKIEAQPQKIREARANIEGQLAEIRTQREILKIQRMNDNLAEQFLNIKSALLNTASVVSDASSSAILTVDDLAGQSADSGASDADFKMAMGL